MRKNVLAVCMIALAVLVAIPAAAANRVITNGLDLWVTEGNGGTYADFSKTPIPAGFFCFKSKPFTGRIVFRGVPIVTAEPGALGRTDTIVHRLDDATFNKRGVASTRIQVRAMTFESIAPVKTACGAFKVRVALDGEQPITRMQIVREDEKGGRFLAPIHVNVKLVFTPVGRRSSEILEITKSIRFPANPQAQWSDDFGDHAVESKGFVLTDTDGDGAPDTHLPGTSNFAAGWNRRGTKAATVTCHIEDSCGHCTNGVTYRVYSTDVQVVE
jgi:hypothetical protein